MEQRLGSVDEQYAPRLPFLPRVSSYLKSTSRYDPLFSHPIIDGRSDVVLCYDTSVLKKSLHTWTKEEDEYLLKAVEHDEADQAIDWAMLAVELHKPHALDCFLRYHNKLSSQINRSEWTASEEKHLLLLVDQYKARDWSEIALQLGTQRTPFECLRHYQQALNNDLVNSANWSYEEDMMLKQAVDRYGFAWKQVAACIPGRVASQCLNRYR